MRSGTQFTGLLTNQLTENRFHRQRVAAEPALRRAPKDQGAGGRPWLFALLVAPNAVTANGVIQGGVLAYMVEPAGSGSGEQSHLIFLLALPTMIYFIWSPLTDFMVRRRTR